MNIHPEQLTETGFKQEFALNHKELIPFVSEYLFKRNRFTLSYLFLNCLFLGLLIYTIAIYLFSSEGNWGEVLTSFGNGCAITFLLIPPHEILHGIAYKLCGAKKVSYKANWRKLYFMAVADKFVTNRNEFYFIALLPVTLISIVMLFAAFFASPTGQIMWLTVGLVHASMCAGDFGLMSFFAQNKQREVVTYDDVENEMSYFYIR